MPCIGDAAEYTERCGLAPGTEADVGVIWRAVGALNLGWVVPRRSRPRRAIARFSYRLQSPVARRVFR